MDERLESFGGLSGSDALAAVVQVDEDVAVMAHAQFLHVGQLAQAVAALNALQNVVVLPGFLILPITAASFLLFLKMVPTVSKARITSSPQFSSFVFCLAIARGVVLCGPALNGLPDINQCHEQSRVIHKFQKSSHHVVVIVIGC